MDKPLREVVGELRALLACPKISELPWQYGQGRIESRISDEWPIDNKTLARAAVARRLVPDLAVRAGGPRWARHDGRRRERAMGAPGHVRGSQRPGAAR